ncbi:hypothetical protein SLEP1_g53267 [Rubroshorea leprosula]|nr:hypothetical protein SLEP1_g53267 [Rubroshorea leprosula]
MVESHGNEVGSLVLDRPAAAAHHTRLWAAFSSSAFRRKIVDAVSCSASPRHRQNEAAAAVSTATSTTTAKSVSEHSEEQKHERVKAKGNKTNVKSEKLSDLLNLVEAESEAETRKKVEVLEELKLVVKELQVGDEATRREAASRARLLAKEDSEARVTLAMLGAIPPLVGMLDFEDADSQIAALYALLNLGIGNDV